LFDFSNQLSTATPVSLLSSDDRSGGDSLHSKVDFLVSSSRAGCAIREQALEAGLVLSWRRLTDRWAGGRLGCERKLLGEAEPCSIVLIVEGTVHPMTHISLGNGQETPQRALLT
jgi:hypothetical protein